MKKVIIGVVGFLLACGPVNTPEETFPPGSTVAYSDGRMYQGIRTVTWKDNQIICAQVSERLVFGGWELKSTTCVPIIEILQESQ